VWLAFTNPAKETNKMATTQKSILSIPGPEVIHRYQLPNDITLLCMENSNSASVNFIGLLKASSGNDPSDKLGLADFCASMLSRGTQDKSFLQIHNLLESAGASLSFSASVQNTWFSGKALAEDLPMLLELTADCLMQPTFPLEYTERMRAQILSSLAIREQDTGDRASMALDKILFPNHPLGEPTDGYPETIQAITREDLIEFHHSNYGSVGMIIVVVGGIQSEAAYQLVSQYFSGWKTNKNKTSKLPEVKPISKTVRQHIEIPEKNQTDIQIGSLGPARKSQDFMPIYLGNDILGQFGMLGRIGEVVRVKAGLAYYAGSSVNSWLEGGVWEFMAGVNPKNTEKAIDLIKQEINKFINEPVTKEELSDSKSHLTGRLALSLESNSGLANAILSMEHFQMGLDYYQRYSGLINAISAEQILESSNRFLNIDHLAIVSAGTSSKGKHK
jgi:zinc protease